MKRTKLEEEPEADRSAEDVAQANVSEAEVDEDESQILEPLIEGDDFDADEGGSETDQALATLAGELDEARDQMLRLRAEFDNYRKRTARDADRVRKTAAEALLRELLPVVDNLERAFDHVEDKTDGLAQGVEMVLKQLCGVLSNHGAEPIPALGEVFDPNVHEALSHLPSEEYPADVVMQEFERGYRAGDYVLRPAKVVVSSGPPEAEAAAADQDEETDKNS